MGIPSWELAKLLDICFSGVLCVPLDGAERKTQPFPDVDQYVKGERGAWTLDFHVMAGEKPFAGLFPQEAKDMTPDTWRAFSDALFKDKKPGGIAGPFIEKDDDAFIRSFNADARVKTPFVRSREFSVPAMFFMCLEDLMIYAVYDPEKNDFEWDFSVITSLKPASEYEAFKRYAHARYSTLAIGQTAVHGETHPRKVHVAGNAVILAAFTRTPDWELVEDALQAFPGKDTYTLSALEDVKSDTLGQQSRRNKMGLKNGKQPVSNRIDPVFDHKDEVNITNAVQDIRSFLSDEDHGALGEAGLFARVRLLYKAVTDPAIRQEIDPRRIKTVETLHSKLEGDSSVNLGAPLSGKDGDETKETFGDTLKSPTATPEQELEDRETRKVILRLFEEKFIGSTKFLHRIRDFIMNESSELIGREIGRYAGRRRHNADSYLFTMFREVGGGDSKIHTLFTEKMRLIIDNLKREEES
jgi:hypothetical protein